MKKFTLCTNTPPFKKFGGGEHTAEIFLKSFEKNLKFLFCFGKIHPLKKKTLNYKKN